MNLQKRMLAATLLATLALAVVPAHAGDDDSPNIFVTLCDRSPDGKVSKSQVMTMVEKMFDKADTNKEGKLDRSQANAFFKSLKGDGGK